ncbi:hypothetical protein ACFV1H_18645 [Streptomyces virginiae]|uniref:hypothetical protein n=1 Tax=Streptomyces virginiae TaxID=1961 RepID=UPI00368E1CB5
MSAWDWAVLLAIGGLLVTVATYWTRSSDSRAYRNAWQQSTSREPQTVADDIPEIRRRREIEQLEAWLTIPPRPRNTIPTQRQPRKDQP